MEAECSVVSVSGQDRAGRREVVFARGAWRLEAVCSSTRRWFDADTLEPFDEPLQGQLDLAYEEWLQS